MAGPVIRLPQQSPSPPRKTPWGVLPVEQMPPFLQKIEMARKAVMDLLEDPANDVMIQPWMVADPARLLTAGSPGRVGGKDLQFFDYMDRLKGGVRGRLFRGMSSEEYANTLRNRAIKSDQRWSVPGEGTSFSDAPETAIDYATFGRTNPSRTGASAYVVEAESNLPAKAGDAYYKTQHPVPLDAVRRVIRLEPSGGVTEVPIGTSNQWVRQWLLQNLAE